MHKYILPKAEHVSGSSIIHQLGLDGEEGLMRMLNILMFKADPECLGITITIEDLNKAVAGMVEEGRNLWLVKGESDQIFMKMCTKEEYKKFTTKPIPTPPTPQ